MGKFPENLEIAVLPKSVPSNRKQMKQILRNKFQKNLDLTSGNETVTAVYARFPIPDNPL